MAVKQSIFSLGEVRLLDDGFDDDAPEICALLSGGVSTDGLDYGIDAGPVKAGKPAPRRWKNCEIEWDRPLLDPRPHNPGLLYDIMLKQKGFSPEHRAARAVRVKQDRAARQQISKWWGARTPTKRRRGVEIALAHAKRRAALQQQRAERDNAYELVMMAQQAAKRRRSARNRFS